MHQCERPCQEAAILTRLAGPEEAALWVCLFWFGPLWAITGAIASHLLYCGTLKPGGICLGIPWLVVAVNSIVVCLVSTIRLLG